MTSGTANIYHNTVGKIVADEISVVALTGAVKMIKLWGKNCLAN